MAEFIRSSVAGESGAASAVQAAPAIPHMLVVSPIVAGKLCVSAAEIIGTRSAVATTYCGRSVTRKIAAKKGVTNQNRKGKVSATSHSARSRPDPQAFASSRKKESDHVRRLSRKLVSPH